MEFWIKAAQLILSLSILVVLHELGHFIPARLFKIRVDKFYLFFDAGFSLFKFKKGDTEYGIGWLPIGGYVKIAGMIDESMDTDHLSKPIENWEFRSKPAWQRLIVMSGGVIVNFVLAFALYVMVLFVWGENYIPNENIPRGMAVNEELKKYGFKDGDHVLSVDGKEIENVLDVNRFLFIRDARVLEVLHKDGVQETIVLPEGTDQMLFQKDIKMNSFVFIPSNKVDSVLVGSPAFISGLLKGDEITEINNSSINDWQDLKKALPADRNQKVLIKVKRGEELVSLNVITDSLGHLGVFPKDPKVENKSYTFSESFSGGFDKAYWTLKDYITQFKFVFTPKGATAVGGIGSVGRIFPPEWHWDAFWELTAILSIMLAFMNLLPIPALDGGYIVFLLYEIVAGRSPSEKFLGNAQVIGLVIVLGLFLYTNGLDVLRWVGVIAE